MSRPRAPHRGAWRDPVLLVVVLLAAAVRLPPCFADLWLDEVWSITLANQLASPLDVFTSFPHSNNHHLNSLFVRAAGLGQPFCAYRLHVLLAGVGSVVVAWAILRPVGRPEAVIGAVLVSSSYLLIHFASEARGYALVVLFGFLTVLAAVRLARGGGWWWAGVLWAAAVLGVLSHLTYVYVFLSVGPWFLLDACRRRTRAGAAADLLRYFAAPAISLALLYAVLLRHVFIGGADPYRLADVLVKTLSYAGGGPGAGAVAAVAALATAGAFLGAIVWLHRAGRSEWLLYAGTVFVAPAAVLGALRPDVLAPQYFIVDVAFGLLALSYLCAGAWRRGGALRWGMAAVLAIHLVGNAANVVRLYRFGRGGYLDGLEYMAANTPGRAVTVTSDHDFRNGMILDFYGSYLPPGKQIRYIPQALQLPVEALETPGAPSAAPGAAWMLFHRFGRDRDVAPHIADRQGTAYELVKTIPYADLSGWHWFIYRKVGRKTPPDVPPDARRGP
jgi:hypothetical protein